MKQFGLPQDRTFLQMLTAFCLLAPAIGGAFGQEPATLPGGASSLRETFQDWIVACVQNETKHCALSQQQTQEKGQRVLGIEIQASPGGKTATGILVLPFGLALDAGVTLQIDDQPAQAPLRFSTCLSGGCLVPLNFDDAFLSALRTGETLKTTANAADSGQAISLSVSLKGFSVGFDRVTALVQ